MKFTCKTDKLRNAISKVERIVSKQSTLPVLKNILLKTEKGFLVIASTNLEMAVKVSIGAKIEEEGSITVPARVLGGFLGALKDENVSGELSGSDLRVNSENHKILIKGIDARDFPIIPESDTKPFIKISNEKISKIISSVLVSVAHNDTRQELNGVFISFSEEEIIFASTDSFRLTEVVLKVDKKEVFGDYFDFVNQNSSVIIPAVALMEIQRAFADEEFIELLFEQNQLFVLSDSVKVVSRLISGNYPEYRQVLPKKYEIEIEVSKKELIDAVKIASLIVNTGEGEMKFSLSESKESLLVSSQSIDSGENVSKITAKIKGDSFEIYFNCKYLIDGLGSSMFDSDKLIFKLNKERSPVVVKDKTKNREQSVDISYIIMPIIKN